MGNKAWVSRRSCLLILSYQHNPASPLRCAAILFALHGHELFNANANDNTNDNANANANDNTNTNVLPHQWSLIDVHERAVIVNSRHLLDLVQTQHWKLFRGGGPHGFNGCQYFFIQSSIVVVVAIAVDDDPSQWHAFGGGQQDGAQNGPTQIGTLDNPLQRLL